MSSQKIKQARNEPTIDLVIDTLDRKKQALVFVNSKKRAEKTAEDISRALSSKLKSAELDKLSEELRNALPRPTTQCIRLAECSKKGVVFHHAGLVSKQRMLIEDSFREGTIKIICCTPTLALGVDLPAFRTIIKDLKRYSARGLSYIPVMEYNQISGRAGRPGKEKFGESIVEVNSEKEQDVVVEKYIKGLPEPILSKLAVEPVLRTYLLSLIATGFVNSKKQIFDFFSRTFWAHQFKDQRTIQNIILRMLDLLEENEFIKMKSKTDFVSASELEKENNENKDEIYATILGKRVAELYIDPLSAKTIIEIMKKANTKKHTEMTFLYMICKTLELRPLLKVRINDYNNIQEKLAAHEDFLFEKFDEYNEDYDVYLDSFKTSLLLNDWIGEKDEEYVLEEYNIRPGELNVKVQNSDWMLYSAEELARILKLKNILAELKKLRMRMEYGVKEELLTLLKLKNVGRVRARKLYKHGYTNIGKIRKADAREIASILGSKIAVNIKEQLGEKISKTEELPEEKKEKKQGQQNLLEYS